MRTLRTPVRFVGDFPLQIYTLFPPVIFIRKYPLCTPRTPTCTPITFIGDFPLQIYTRFPPVIFTRKFPPRTPEILLPPLSCQEYVVQGVRGDLWVKKNNP